MTKFTTRASIALTVAVFFLTSIACVGEIDDGEDPEARIILGRSIDGVMIGDDSLTVIGKIGAPDTIVGDDFRFYFQVFS